MNDETMDEIANDQYSDLLIEEIASLKKKLAIAEAVLDELATGCTHDEKDENYRALCRGYGWCNLCVTKVSYKENIGKEALAAIREKDES